MPLLSFSGETSVGPFYKTIPLGIKTQTCRTPRVYPIKIGDKLYLWWKSRSKYGFKIGEAICVKVERLHYKNFAYYSDSFARRDGFQDSIELREWFGDPQMFGSKLYDVIYWGEFQ